VRDGGVVEDVIAIIVRLDLSDELLMTLRGR